MMYEEDAILIPERDLYLMKNTKQTIFSRFHTHDYYEFFVLSDGSITESRETSRTILTKGDTIFIRPGDSHGYPEWRKEKYIFYNLAFKKSLWNELTLTYPSLPWSSLLSAKLPIAYSMNDYDLEFCIYSLEWIFRLQSPEQIRIAGINFLSRIAQQFWFNGIDNIDNNSPPWLSKTLARLDDNRLVKEGMNYLKEQICVSYEHFSRTFKKSLCQTPAQYIKKRRTHLAKALLQGSDLSISEISEECGYENLSHFHHQFKDVYGVSPLKYKKDLYS